MSKWYVVQSKPRQEALAQENLERQGYFTYCPYMPQVRRQRGKWQAVSLPLFPCYLFIRLTEGEDNFSPIRSTLGVSQLLRFGDKPAHISQQAINAIRCQQQQLAQDEADKLPWKPGEKIQLLDGPFAGLSGIFQKKSSQDRVVILMELLGKENRITVSSNYVTSA